MEMNVFLDDGEGFIDLGLDNVYEYNDDGDLIMEYDGTWLALNGQIVSYYMVSDDHDGDTYSIKGRVPALLNDQLVDIIVVFDNENPDGVVLGAQVKYDAEATQTGTVARGLLDIVAGDKIDYLCDYYTYDGTYNDTYYLGEPVHGDRRVDDREPVGRRQRLPDDLPLHRHLRQPVLDAVDQRLRQVEAALRLGQIAGSRSAEPPGLSLRPVSGVVPESAAPPPRMLNRPPTSGIEDLPFWTSPPRSPPSRSPKPPPLPPGGAPPTDEATQQTAQATALASGGCSGGGASAAEGTAHALGQPRHDKRGQDEAGAWRR